MSIDTTPYPGPFFPVPAQPSQHALAVILREAQTMARRPVTPATTLREINPLVADPGGYAVLMCYEGFNDFDFPQGERPQTLWDVARIYDFLAARRDVRDAHRRRMADGTPPPVPVAMPADFMAQLHAAEATRPAPARVAPAPAAAKKSRLSAIKPWHILAAMFGAFGLFLSINATSMGTEWPAWVIPIGSAVLVGWLLYQVLPPWVPALLVGGMGLLAAVKVMDTKERDQQQMDESRLDYAMHDVCDGKPLNRESNGWKLRDFNRHEGSTYWATTGGWTAGKIPTYTLCTEHKSEDVQCGDFTDTKSDRPTRLCTSRDLATVTLRRTKTAEVVFTKSYTGGEPPPLPYSVQFGGYSSTKLSGDSVSYEKDIFPDIEKLVAQP